MISNYFERKEWFQHDACERYAADIVGLAAEPATATVGSITIEGVSVPVAKWDTDETNTHVGEAYNLHQSTENWFIVTVIVCLATGILFPVAPIGAAVAIVTLCLIGAVIIYTRFRALDNVLEQFGLQQVLNAQEEFMARNEPPEEDLTQRGLLAAARDNTSIAGKKMLKMLLEGELEPFLQHEAQQAVEADIGQAAVANVIALRHQGKNTDPEVTDYEQRLASAIEQHKQGQHKFQNERLKKIEIELAEVEQAIAAGPQGDVDEAAGESAATELFLLEMQQKSNRALARARAQA